MPTRTARPIAFSTALGARGCSDMKAVTRNTNGTSASPSAIAAAGFGPAWLFFDAVETKPARIAQNAGTRIMVATVIARHFRRGGSGSIPPERVAGCDRFCVVTVPTP